MADIESLLSRWQRAGVLDAEAAARIRAFEEKQDKPGGLRWQGMVALILGAMLLACGVALFVSAHWDELGPGARYAIVIAMVAVFHLAGVMITPAYHASLLQTTRTAFTVFALFSVAGVFASLSRGRRRGDGITSRAFS